MDRTRIREALAQVDAAGAAVTDTLNDQEVQALLERGARDEALALIAERYPLNDRDKRHAAQVELVRAMTDGLPEWRDVNPDKVVGSAVHFMRLLALARRV